jgi:hypothetical protein
VLPTGALGLAGVIDKEDRVAGVTVRVVFPVILPEVAVIIALPAATPVAKPLPVTVATAVLDDLQVTCVDISPVVPSEYVPEAVNCLVFPAGTLGLAGAKDMEDRVAGDTVRAVLPEILPEAALMVAVPAPTAVARPLPSTVAAAVLDELQADCMVISLVVPSEYAPEAVNCLVFPAGMLGRRGVTDMEDRVAGSTVRVVFPEILPEVAVMVALPAATAVAKPLPVMVATVVLDDLQVTPVVIL